MEPAFVEEHKGYRIAVYYDESAECPLSSFEWGGRFLLDKQYQYFSERRHGSMIGRFCYDISDAEDEILTDDDVEEGKSITAEQFYEWIKLQYDAVILLPLRDKGDGELSIDYDIDTEDRRFAGFFYATAKDIEKFQGSNDAKAIENELRCIEADLYILNAWGRGECYGYGVFAPTITTSDKYLDYLESIDGVWGYYGNDIKENGLLEAAKDFIEFHIRDQERQMREMKNPVQLNKFIAGE